MRLAMMTRHSFRRLDRTEFRLYLDGKLAAKITGVDKGQI